MRESVTLFFYPSSRKVDRTYAKIIGLMPVSRNSQPESHGPLAGYYRLLSPAPLAVNHQLRAELQELYYRHIAQNLLEDKVVFRIQSRVTKRVYYAGWCIYSSTLGPGPDSTSIWLHEDFAHIENASGAPVDGEGKTHAGMGKGFASFWVDTRTLESVRDRRGGKSLNPIGDAAALEAFEQLHRVLDKLKRTLIVKLDATPLAVFARLRSIGEMIARTFREARIFDAEEARMSRIAWKAKRDRLSGL